MVWIRSPKQLIKFFALIIKTTTTTTLKGLSLVLIHVCCQPMCDIATVTTCNGLLYGNMGPVTGNKGPHKSIAGMLAKFTSQLPKRTCSNEWFGIFQSSSSSSSTSTSSSSSSSSSLLLLQLRAHTLVPSLESLHQRCPVNARQKHNSQNHSFQNTHDAREHSNDYVVEEKEVWHNGKQASERKKLNNDIFKKFTGLEE